MQYTISPVGKIHTPFKQKFGIPRQGHGVSIAKGEIEFESFINVEDACQGLSEFSHLWVLFLFSEHLSLDKKQSVRPPRLGGNKSLGVFATRSSFRPNNIGMTVVKNIGLTNGNLLVEGVDMLDQTPIIDIKPYIRYADNVDDSQCGYASCPPEQLNEVIFMEGVKDKIQAQKIDPRLITNILAQDPRPAYKKNKNDLKTYKINLYGFDIHWRIEGKTIVVINSE